MRKLIYLLLFAIFAVGCNEEISDEIQDSGIKKSELTKQSVFKSQESSSNIDVQALADIINSEVTAEWVSDRNYEDIVVYNLPSINGLETCYTFLISNPIDGHLYYKNYDWRSKKESGGFLCSNEDGSRNLYRIDKKIRESVPSGENHIRLYTVSIPSTGEGYYLYGLEPIKFIKP